MGILETLFGGKKYPELDKESPEARKLDDMKDSLVKLTEKVNDPMEIVPDDGSAYVFIGKPPKNFGMAWIKDGRVHNFKTLSEEKDLPQNEMLKLVDELARAYRRSDETQKYSATIGGKTVTVTPSPDLAGRVKKIIANA
jgi:hypothetical protein